MATIQTKLEIRFNFQFNLYNCQEPKDIKTKIIKETKTENRNLFFKS